MRISATQKTAYTILTVITIAILSVIYGCNRDVRKTDKQVITVSIPPIKYLVEEITCGDFDINVILPHGSSPETYSPTPQQLIDVSKSDILFYTGLLDFENELMKRLPDTGKPVSLSVGMDLISDDGHDHNHNGLGVDPHIWTSPERLKIMSANIYDAVNKRFPDSTKYTTAYSNLIERLDSLSAQIKKTLNETSTKVFVIYHPALTYYAEDYGLTQISIENEGKEPSATHLKSVIETINKENIGHILYQQQFSVSVTEAVSKETNATPIEIDPLAENIVAEITAITNIISSR